MDAAALLLEDVLAQLGAVGADVDIVGAFDHRAYFARALAAERAGGDASAFEAAIAAEPAHRVVAIVAVISVVLVCHRFAFLYRPLGTCLR